MMIACVEMDGWRNTFVLETNVDDKELENSHGALKVISMRRESIKCHQCGC